MTCYNGFIGQVAFTFYTSTSSLWFQCECDRSLVLNSLRLLGISMNWSSFSQSDKSVRTSPLPPPNLDLVACRTSVQEWTLLTNWVLNLICLHWHSVHTCIVIDQSILVQLCCPVHKHGIFRPLLPGRLNTRGREQTLIHVNWHFVWSDGCQFHWSEMSVVCTCNTRS